MVVYYFHIQNGSLTLDNVGSSLANLDVAKIEAIRLLGGLITDDPEELLVDGAMKVMVTNASGALLFALELSTVVPPTISPRLVQDFL